jgi:hypothetical protein
MVPRWKSLLAILTLVCSVVAVSPLDAGTRPIEGRWRLVEQRLGDDGPDRGPEITLWLEFRSTGTGVAARLSRDGAWMRSTEWPAPSVDAPAVRVTVDRIELSAAGDRIEARYTADPQAGDGTRVEFVETYRVTDGGRSLAGTVTVHQLRDGADGGSYRLYRRFERVD